MINGYPDQTSIFPRAVITFHVSTDAPQFRIEIYRQGEDLARLLVSNWFAGVNAPDHDADEDWGVDSTKNNQLRSAWPGYDIAIPVHWRSGVFIAMFVEGDGSGNERGNTPPLDRTSPDARSGKALFVVRDAAPGVNARILYKVPLFTYQAYNKAGGWSLYQNPCDPCQVLNLSVVSMRRPGGGTGGNPWDFLDGYFNPGNPGVPLQTFAQWDAPFIAWLEREGYSADYMTDLDLHVEDGLLTPYAVVLSVGHDEYWSDAMRDQAEAYIASGGNFAFFSGNTCWWRVTFDDSIRFRRTGNWYLVSNRTADWYDPLGPKRPENALTGVSYRHAGEGDKDRPRVGYIVQNASHWAFADTGLNDGDTFGEGEWLVGYECDGANFDRGRGPPFSPKLDDGTPATFVILAVGDVSVFNGKQGNAAATMGVYTNGGTVFTAATTDWPRVVGLNGEPRTVQITRNVLSNLSNGGSMANVRSWQGSVTGDLAPGDVDSWIAFPVNYGEAISISAHPFQSAETGPTDEHVLAVENVQMESNSGGRRIFFDVRNTGQTHVVAYLIGYAAIS